MMKAHVSIPAPIVERMTKADALMAVAVAAAAADGRLRQRELERLRLMLHISPMFRGVLDADGYIESVARDLQSLGLQRFVERAADSLEPRLRETAYAWASDVVRSDRSVDADEDRFLESLRRVLHIHPALASKIRAVTAIRGREG